MVTASSHGAAFGGAYTATFGAFSSGTASMFSIWISARMPSNAPSSSGSLVTPASAASRAVTASPGRRNAPFR